MPGLSVPEGIENRRAHVLHGGGGDRCLRSDAGLQREQIGVAAAIERNRGHLPAGDHLAQLGAGGFDMQRVVGHAHGLRDAADFERSIERERRIGVEHNVLALIAENPEA